MTSWPDLAGRFESGAHVLPVRVYYEDTDFTGIVYHGAYVRFFERGRSDFLRLAGVQHANMQADGSGHSIAFAVRAMTIDFLKTATIDDELEVLTRLAELKGARIILEQEIRRGGDILVTARVTVAVITGEGRPTRLPEDLVDRLKGV